VDSALDKSDSRDYLVPLLFDLCLLIKQGDLEECDHLVESYFLLDVFHLFALEIAQIIALRKDLTDVDAMLPDELNHVVSECNLGCERFEALDMIDVLVRLTGILNASLALIG